MNINDGGQAFPRTDQDGMSLRDYFAYKAMVAIMSSPEMICFAKKTADELKAPGNPVAFISYDFADAMITERQKRVTAAQAPSPTHPHPASAASSPG